MTSKVYPIVYDRQFEKYIGQFMRAISGFQVKNGVTRNGDDGVKRVGVVWGGMERIAASIMSNKSDHLVNQRLPVIGVNLSGIVPDASTRQSPYWKEPITKRQLQASGTKTAIQRLVGQSYIVNMDATVYASSTSELFMIVEQLLSVFNPRLVIQTDVDASNADYITSIDLESIQPEISYPLGDSSQECMMTFGFSIPVRLRYPMARDKSVVEEIITNVMTNDDTTPIFTESIRGL